MSASQNLVDIPFALSQLGGNSDLLKRMLTRFQQEFISIPKDVKAFIASENLKEAKMKVHTTKGLTGNLGLMALYDCSKTLDQQLRDNTVSPELVEIFEQLMQETCAFIDTLDLAAKDQPSFDTEHANNAHIDDFIQRLERNEFIDDETLHKYVNTLSIEEHEKHILIGLVEELKYSEAISIIQALQQ